MFRRVVPSPRYNFENDVHANWICTFCTRRSFSALYKFFFAVNVKMNLIFLFSLFQGVAVEIYDSLHLTVLWNQQKNLVDLEFQLVISKHKWFVIKPALNLNRLYSSLLSHPNLWCLCTSTWIHSILLFEFSIFNFIVGTRFISTHVCMHA